MAWGFGCALHCCWLFVVLILYSFLSNRSVKWLVPSTNLARRVGNCGFEDFRACWKLLRFCISAILFRFFQVLVNDKNPRALPVNLLAWSPRPTFSLAALEAACCSSNFPRWHVSLFWNRYCQLPGSDTRSPWIAVHAKACHLWST